MLLETITKDTYDLARNREQLTKRLEQMWIAVAEIILDNPNFQIKRVFLKHNMLFRKIDVSKHPYDVLAFHFKVSELEYIRELDIEALGRCSVKTFLIPELKNAAKQIMIIQEENNVTTT